MKLAFSVVAVYIMFVSIGCNSGSGASSASDTARPALEDSTAYTTLRWKDSMVDLGTLKMGEKKKVEFAVVNTGNKNLFIYEARPSCGCTVADYTKTPIAPGKEGVVTAEFDTNKSHPGTARKSIFVRTNTNTNFNNTYLIFTANIVADSTKANDAK